MKIVILSILNVLARIYELGFTGTIIFNNDSVVSNLESDLESLEEGGGRLFR